MGKYICAEVIHEIVKRTRWNNEIAKETALCIIEEAEPADVEPVVHAHWIEENIGGGNVLNHCSNCQAVFWGGGRYCSNCGARMDEVTTNG